MFIYTALLDKPPDVISTASSVLESEFIPLDSDSDSDSALKPSTSGRDDVMPNDEYIMENPLMT